MDTTEEIKNDAIKKHIDAIIESTFEALKIVYESQKEGRDKNPEGRVSRLVFPQYGSHRNHETRLSEQELRFLFVEQFNNYCKNNTECMKWFYSVETPTEYKYSFKDHKAPKKIGEYEDGGQSAMVDLSIHDESLRRIALIEFKANNPDKFSYRKDFVKLGEEPANILKYFVIYIERTESDTIPNIAHKIDYKDYLAKINFRCFVLSNFERGIIKNEDIQKYKNQSI